MVSRRLGRLGRNRNIQTAADDIRDASKRNSLFSDPVMPDSRGTLLKGKFKKMGGIEPVNRRPAVERVPHLRRNACPPRDADEGRDEAVIAVAMDGW